MRTNSSKTNKLRNIYMHTTGMGARNISIKKLKLYYNVFQTQNHHVYETMSFVFDKSKSKRRLQYQRNSTYLTEVQWDISDSPFVRNKDDQF